VYLVKILTKGIITQLHAYVNRFDKTAFLSSEFQVLIVLAGLNLDFLEPLPVKTIEILSKSKKTCQKGLAFYKSCDLMSARVSQTFR
jgi:hypothetical protein